VERFLQIGADEATPGPEVVPAIMQSDVVLIAPSNPVVSIGAILSVPGIRAALQRTPAPVIGVSPIVAGRAVRGMADRCLAAIGVPCTALGVGLHYGARSAGGLIDGFLVDAGDAEAVGGLQAAAISARALPLMMTDESESARIAAAALALADDVRA
jgi:LPPG:FO 2-phospho-L-lactate transferase